MKAPLFTYHLPAKILRCFPITPLSSNLLRHFYVNQCSNTETEQDDIHMNKFIAWDTLMIVRLARSVRILKSTIW